MEPNNLSDLSDEPGALPYADLTLILAVALASFALLVVAQAMM